MSFTTFFNARLCIGGQMVDERLVVSEDSGLILPSTGYIGGDAVDLEGAIIAPGFLELHTNGCLGFHFVHHQDPDEYNSQVDRVGRFLATKGVTGFWATLPTCKPADFKQLLPLLRPRSIEGGAVLLGAHAEGPYLHASKKGAHNQDLFVPATTPPREIYGEHAESSDILKLVTIAPELEGAASLVQSLHARGIRVSLGHSSASFEHGLEAVAAGASCLTHTLNAMAPLHHRDPGLAGLLTAPSGPYYTMIADGNHLHSNVVALLYRANPERAIIITDSIELAGLPDGVYPGHAQIPHPQRKEGSRVTIDGTNTLVGGCASLQECMQNLKKWSACTIAESVRCVTENVVDLMHLTDRGKLEAGRRADFVVLDDDGEILQTWVAGKKVWEKTD